MNRRNVAGALVGLGAVAAGMKGYPAHPVQAAGADAALLALIAEAEAIDRENDRLWDACAALPGTAPEHDAWLVHTDATRPRWRELVALIDVTPARTGEGLRAKARYTLATVPGEQRDGPNPCDTLAWSVLRDVLAGEVA